MMDKKISRQARHKQYQEKYQRGFTKQWFWFCREPLENIEGWSEMLDDTHGQRWHLHHRDEISEGGKVVSREKLISSGKYYNLPASKLIFMTEFEHKSLHHRSENLSAETKKKKSEAISGKNNPMYGKTGTLNPNYGRNKYGITEEELHELYVVQRLTQQKIAKKFGCSQMTICLNLKKFGIRKQDV